MDIGVSTACYYPQETERCFQELLENGVTCFEVFGNCPTELEIPFMQLLRSIAQGREVKITALHPFSSWQEPWLFFGNYPRRLQDGLEQYRHLFESAAYLGVSYVVFHGDSRESRLELAESLERYNALHLLAKEFGLHLAQENVSRCRSGSPEYIRELKRQIPDVCFVLDTKQALRAGHTVAETRAAMGDRLCHVHFSDSTPQQDCLPPGTGCFDCAGFLAQLRRSGFAGDVIIELYRQNFTDTRQLVDSYQFLKKL